MVDITPIGECKNARDFGTNKLLCQHEIDGVPINKAPKSMSDSNLNG